MSRQTYRLTESVAAFPEGEILDVTARFGDWHVADIELEPRRRCPGAPQKLVVAASDTGFSEDAILDPTARIGDWQECDLAFEPGRTEDRGRLSPEAFDAVAEPIDA